MASKATNKNKYFVVPTDSIKSFDSQEDAASYLIEQRDANAVSDLGLIIGRKPEFSLKMSIAIEKAKRTPRRKKTEDTGTDSTPTSTPRRGRTPTVTTTETVA